MSGVGSTPVLFVFAVVLAMPVVGSFFRSTYGLPAEKNSSANIRDILPEISAGQKPIAVSFGVAGCQHTCPAQIATLRQLADSADLPFRAFFLTAADGPKSFSAGSSEKFREIGLGKKKFADAAWQLSGRRFPIEATDHDSAIYVFSAVGKLLFVYPFLPADPVKIVKDIRGVRNE